MRLDIKPLSVNEAWQGKRFKTPKYNRYITSVAKLLKPFDVPAGYLQLSLVFGLSSKNADFDNPVKCFVDCLQKNYGFNDKMIKRCIIEVEHVAKGQEFINWEMTQLKELV